MTHVHDQDHELVVIERLSDMSEIYPEPAPLADAWRDRLEESEPLPDPPDYLAEDAARRRFEIEHAAWMEEHGPEYERIMAELEAEHPAPLPEPEGPDDEPWF